MKTRTRQERVTLVIAIIVVDIWSKNLLLLCLFRFTIINICLILSLWSNQWQLTKIKVHRNVPGSTGFLIARKQWLTRAEAVQARLKANSVDMLHFRKGYRFPPKTAHSASYSALSVECDVDSLRPQNLGHGQCTFIHTFLGLILVPITCSAAVLLNMHSVILFSSLHATYNFNWLIKISIVRDADRT